MMSYHAISAIVSLSGSFINKCNLKWTYWYSAGRRQCCLFAPDALRMVNAVPAFKIISLTAGHVQGERPPSSGCKRRASQWGAEVCHSCDTRSDLCCVTGHHGFRESSLRRLISWFMASCEASNPQQCILALVKILKASVEKKKGLRMSITWMNGWYWTGRREAWQPGPGRAGCCFSACWTAISCC